MTEGLNAQKVLVPFANYLSNIVSPPRVINTHTSPVCQEWTVKGTLYLRYSIGNGKGWFAIVKLHLEEREIYLPLLGCLKISKWPRVIRCLRSVWPILYKGWWSSTIVFNTLLLGQGLELQLWPVPSRKGRKNIDVAIIFSYFTQKLHAYCALTYN